MVPTLTALADGRVPGHYRVERERRRPQPATGVLLCRHQRLDREGFVDGFPGLPLYAHLFLLADGRIFFSGGRMDDPLDVQPCVFDLAQTPVPTDAVPDLLAPDFATNRPACCCHPLKTSASW